MRTQSKTRENRAQDKVVIALKLKLIGWERGESFFKPIAGEEKQNRDKIGFLSTLA